jgi:hypothetical protein
MSSKNKTPIAPSTSPQTLKIGSRVRCTDDGIEGRITWANGVSVKIQWDDGEQVAWRRDSLADRSIEFLDGSGDEEHPEALGEPVPDRFQPLAPPRFRGGTVHTLVGPQNGNFRRRLLTTEIPSSFAPRPKTVDTAIVYDDPNPRCGIRL